MGGKEALVYQARQFVLLTDQKVIVWIDPDSHLPIQIQATDVKWPADAGIHFIATGFSWNADVHESLFGLGVPDDYTLTKAVKMDIPTQEDLVEALALCAEMADGRFPREFNELAAWDAADAIRPTGSIPEEEHKKMLGQAVNIFKQVPGLKLKYFIDDPKTGEAGGIYIFESREAMDNYLQSDVWRNVVLAVAKEKPRIETYDVIATTDLGVLI